MDPVSLLIENVIGLHDVDAEHLRVEWHLHQPGRHGVRRLRFGDVTADLLAHGHGHIDVDSDRLFTLVVNGRELAVQWGGTTVRGQRCRGCVDVDGTTIMTDIFDQSPTLADDRVLLRPLVDDDLDHLLRFSLGEPELWRHGLVSAAGRDNLRAYIAAAVQQRRDRRGFPFIVFDKQANAFAGCTRFYDVQQPSLTACLGYTWYGAAFQGTGLNGHCKLLLLTYAFEEWGLERCEFRADARNARSIAALRAIGCVQEGVLRNHLPTPDGGRRDTVVLSILRDEWLGGTKQALERKIALGRGPAGG